MKSIKIKNVVLLFGVVTLLFGSYAFGQLSKANMYFSQEKYVDAIGYYNKVLKKDPNNIEAVQNIAFSYRKLKDYQNAEVFYIHSSCPMEQGIVPFLH